MQQRMKIHIGGIVQGVGFRPFVYTLAQTLDLTGSVQNSAQGVTIDVEGERDFLLDFVHRIECNPPQHARITALSWQWDTPQHYTTFEILDSDPHGEKSALVLPDLAICPDCLRELFDPHNRRYRYPFTNCTHCGPRYTIIQALPYDRVQTTMKHFTMCAACQREYDDPTNRRFHAQPNACPVCGPQLLFCNRQGEMLGEHDTALLLAADALRNGQILACKGLGGFHLMVDARNHEAVQRLRERKHRPHKPFATLFPLLESVQACCAVSELEAQTLQSSAAPIVLLRMTDSTAVASNITLQNPYLGVMLPYTPLHMLLMRELGFPIVATSGNLSDEPICTDNDEALARLAGIADVFLMHNRPIGRPLDDSVVQIVLGELQILRLARGYAPQSLMTDAPCPPMLSTGGHLKNAIAISHHNQLVLSQHIGDLETPEAYAAFQRTIQDFERLYALQPSHVAHDLHPDYVSTQYARTLNCDCHPVQHHIAHALAGQVDNHIEGDFLGVVWDGTGYGLDKTIWGGEWFQVKADQFERIAHLALFPLVGGDAAIKEPSRAALGVLYALYGEAAFDHELIVYEESQRRIFRQMLEKGINTPQTSSMGRLFDAVASLLNLQQRASFEGQAAMAVEFAAMQSSDQQHYPFDIALPLVDWKPMLHALIQDQLSHVSASDIAARFLNTLAEIVTTTAQIIGEQQRALTPDVRGPQDRCSPRPLRHPRACVKTP